MSNSTFRAGESGAAPTPARGVDDGQLRFSIRCGSGVDPEEFRRAAVMAEQLGFDQIWTGNDQFRRSGVIPMTLALHSTTRIRVGSSVLNPVTMHPVELAGIAAALADLSGNRFILGLGAGSEVFLPWAGIQPESPVARTRRGLRATRALLDGRSPADVVGTGDGWQSTAVLKDGGADVPIYLGVMGPKLLALAGREADGVIALCLPATRFPWVKTTIESGAAEAAPDFAAGRRPFDLGVGLWTSIDDDAETAKRLLAVRIATYSGALSRDALQGAGYDPERFDRMQQLVTDGRLDEAVALVDDHILTLGIAGDAGQVVEQCLELIDQGARHLSFSYPRGADASATIALVGASVLPILRRSHA
jgi:5,10-methylenetetrahydromethanopterin reductase